MRYKKNALFQVLALICKLGFPNRLFQIEAPDMGWIRHVRLVDSLPTTERGAGGFGSTGKA